MSRGDREPDVPNALGEHARECADCAVSQDEIARVGSALRRESIDLDTTLLSRRVAAMVAPELARLAGQAFRRRVAFYLGLALIPLPLVLAYDAFVLRLVFHLLSGLLPEALATYVVASMALSGLLVIASAYAAIPLLVDRQTVSQPVHL
jgi:hypothetical protein